MEKLFARTVSSLEKLFLGEDYLPPQETEGVLFQNGTLDFSVVFRSQVKSRGPFPVKVQVESPLQQWISLRRVESVPSHFPAYDDADESYLRTKPGLYPDVLLPLSEGIFPAVEGELVWLWAALEPKEKIAPGMYPVTLRFTAGEEETAVTYQVEVLPYELPEQKLLFTQWFHSDSMAKIHGVKIFSEEYWQLFRRYIKMAADHGMNLLLTPLFTPALDVQEGQYRETCQLVKVKKTGETYTFDFSLLGKWLKEAEVCGITHFEMSHLFTQWGAKAAPKIMAETEEGETMVFGWHTPSDSPAYAAFLKVFLPALGAYLKEKQVLSRCFFHIADETGKDFLTLYQKAAALVEEALPGCPILDAMSDYEIYAQSSLTDPVVALDAIDPFLEHQVKPLWGYVCCGQSKKVSNRFFSLPSGRNRILGVQAYLYGLKGFLHWGYNFYFTQYSKKLIDPYAVTDAGRAFPSGDPFSVYPYEDGCIESLRLKVFREGLEDYRALCLLEEKQGREAVLQLLAGLSEKITFEEYPVEPEFFHSLRKEIGKALENTKNL